MKADGAAITIRRTNEGDGAAIRRLAELDSATPPRGDLLAAERGGRMMAAITIDDGTVIADPFAPTLATVELLRLRLEQLRPGRSRRQRFRLPFTPRRARGALAGSPPGAGG